MNTAEQVRRLFTVPRFDKDCPACEGDGRVESCARGHGSVHCPCPTRRRECGDCEGTGRQPMTDEEIEALGLSAPTGE